MRPSKEVNPIPRPPQALHGADCVLLAPQALQVPVSAGGNKVLHQWLDEDKQVVRKL